MTILIAIIAAGRVGSFGFQDLFQQRVEVGMGNSYPSGATQGWSLGLCVFVCFEVAELQSDAWEAQGA